MEAVLGLNVDGQTMEAGAAGPVGHFDLGDVLKMKPSPILPWPDPRFPHRSEYDVCIQEGGEIRRRALVRSDDLYDLIHSGLGRFMLAGFPPLHRRGIDAQA